MIGVYLHIPYCKTICPYCDFVRQSIHGSVPSAFIDAICLEIAGFSGPSDICSIFFGGGTPSLIPPADLERVLDTLRQRFRFTSPDPAFDGPEITIEANPDDVTPDLVRAWRALGVNRISLGVQSFDDDVLRYLGRRHDADGARRACEAVAAVFENWSMDLIFGARPVDRWQATLDECARFRPPHVSTYGLTFEPGTPFAQRAHEAIDDDNYLEIYDTALASLYWLERYEVSNFARPGFECRHNLLYWRNREYAGFGTAAYSFINGIRARNLVETDAYLARPGEKSEAIPLTDAEIRVETMIQHFRLRDGLSKTDYIDRFGATPEDDFRPALTELETRALIVDDGTRLFPTPLGFVLNNEIGLALVGLHV